MLEGEKRKWESTVHMHLDEPYYEQLERLAREDERTTRATASLLLKWALLKVQTVGELRKAIDLVRQSRLPASNDSRIE